MAQTTNPLAVATGQETQSLASLLKSDAYANRFKQVLGERAPQFCSSLISIGNSMPDVEPRSIIGAAMTAACLDLTIDKNLGFAWIIPYNDRHTGKKVAQFQMGYRGLVQLGQRSAQYAKMNACAINREVFLGYDEVGEPRLDWEQYDPDKEVWGYFFGFRLINGFTKTAVWSKEKVKVHAQRYSQSYRAGKDIWRDQFDGMALKTVVANTLRKWGPLSVQLQQAFQVDQAVIRDMDAAPEYIDADAEPVVEKPVAEHPEVKKQKEAKAKAEEKKAPPVEEKKPEPPPTAPAVAAEEKAEADMGLAPEQPKAEPAPANVVPMPEAKPEPVPEPAPAPEVPKELKAGQAALKSAIESAGYSFDDMINSLAGKVAGFPKKNDPKSPKDWSQVDETKAAFCVKSIKGLVAAIKNAKDKGAK